MTVGPTSAAILARARLAGIEIPQESAAALTAHAQLILGANERLHLTAITDAAEFLERHLGEAFEGAALIPKDLSGFLLDLGSGNGYPGIPIAHARPRLTPILAEASTKKAAFLREALAATRLPEGRILEAQVTRAADLEGLASLSVIVTRAMGDWERIVPRLANRLTDNGMILIWAGSDAPAVLARRAWSKLKLVEARRLPGRDRSLIYRLAKA